MADLGVSSSLATCVVLLAHQNVLRIRVWVLRISKAATACRV
jgi:hypothetical protein